MLAVTDEGNWIAADLVYDGWGRLVGLRRGRIGALADLSGQPLKGKRRQDAEALARLANDDLLVAFEHDHRLWRYGADGSPFKGAAAAISLPAGLRRLPDNAGLEALAALADGRVLALAQARRTQGAFRAYLWRQEAWQSLSYPAVGQFRPTGAATLPDGGLVVLERSFSYAGGIMARVMRLDLAADASRQPLAPQELAFLKPPLTLDNFEAVDARLGPQGETLIYLLSDDNFSFWQRSLLLLFELNN